MSFSPALSAPDVREISTYNALTDYVSVKYIYQESFQPPFTVAMLDTRLHSAERVWVYLINNEIVGYLMLATERGAAYLSQVATRSTARRRGVATGLITRAAQMLRAGGTADWWLQTNFQNPAQKLYFDLGFRVSGFQKHLYGLDKHGIEMTQDLTF